MISVGSSSEGDGVVLAIRSHVGVLAGDSQGSVFRLRVVDFAFFLSRCSIAGFIPVNNESVPFFIQYITR